jgi:hypothetical protein
MQKRWCTSKPPPPAGRRHTCSAHHFTVVSEYRALVEAERQRREMLACFATERDELGPLPTLREYLVGRRAA